MKFIGMRMRSGEDVVAELLSSGNDKSKVKIRRPFVPVTSPERDPMGNPIAGGREVLHFLKWCPYASDEEFTVPKDAYVTRYAPAKEIEDFYLQVTSGIQIANAGQLNG